MKRGRRWRCSKKSDGRAAIVIPSAVENGAAWEAATWTGRPQAEGTGSERIKSRDETEGNATGSLLFGRNDTGHA